MGNISYNAKGVPFFDTTYAAEEYVKSQLKGKEQMVEVVDVRRVSYSNPTTTVRFLDEDYNVILETEGGFCIGYSGRGPWGIHDILVWLGFNEKVAKMVFEQDRQRLLVEKSTMDFLAKSS